MKLILIRCDVGSGGWSLHTQEQIDAAGPDEAPDYVISGEATFDEEARRWDRPNRADYALARQIAADAE